MQSLTLMLAMVTPSAAFIPVNTTQLGQCFSPYVYTLILNAASAAESIAKAELANHTVRFPNGTFNPDDVDGTMGDFRIQIETGNRVTTIITLFVIGGVSLVLLMAGEALVNTVTVLTSLLTSFMAFLYLWQWACSSTVAPMDGFVKCLLPFILAVLCAVIVAGLVALLLRKITSLCFFVMGAAGGAFACFMLRQFILAGNPDLATNSWFNFYWLGLAVVALLCGIIAVLLKRSVIRLVTCLLGGYAFAIALCGLIPVFGGPYCANYTFFIVAFVAMAAGFVFQCFCCKPDPEKAKRMEQYRADQKERKAQQKKGKGVEMNRHQDNAFIAP